MRIAMMVRGYLPVPRPLDMVYAPIDIAVDTAEALARRGHQVDFYAPRGSQLKYARVQDCGLRPLVKSYDDYKNLISSTEKMTHYLPALWDNYLVSKMFERAKDGYYDLLHFHHPDSALPVAQNNPGVPVIYTLHDPIYKYYRELFELYAGENQHFISISDNQRRKAPDLPYTATVHNGIDISKFHFNSRPDDYLLFVGRIVPEKGAKEAINIAKETEHRLLIIGPTPVFPWEMEYFETQVKPKLDEQILYLGFIERDKLNVYYKNAKALLAPVQWEEPFGLTTIEAMASGTPVITFRRGAGPEIVKHGENGYVVDNTTEMIAAVRRIKRISRTACRRYAKKNFSIRQMVNGYEEAYNQVLRRYEHAPGLQERLRLGAVPRVLKKISGRRASKHFTNG